MGEREGLAANVYSSFQMQLGGYQGETIWLNLPVNMQIKSLDGINYRSSSTHDGVASR